LNIKAKTTAASAERPALQQTAEVFAFAEPARPVQAPVEASPPPRREKKKSRKQPPPVGRWLAAVAAAIFLPLAGFGLWYFWPSSDPGREEFPLTREPVAGRLVQPIATFPDPVAWQVKPDGVKPADSLPSAFALPGAGWVEAIRFSSPETAQAAVLNASLVRPGEALTRRLEWLRYDLRTTEPAGRVVLAEKWAEKQPASGGRWSSSPSAQESGLAPLAADLSPSGNVLAFRNESDPVTVEVWTHEPERRLAELKAAQPVAWLALLDDTRLLVLAGGRLSLRQLPEGKEVYAVGKGLDLPVVLSPGRQWVAAFAGDGFAWVQAADGKEAGRFLLPERAALEGPPAAALSLDGRSFAAVLAYADHADVVVWDVETGRGREGHRHGKDSGTFARPEFVQWCGPRQLLLGGFSVYDLDLAHPVLTYRPRKGMRFSPTTPDGRAWFTVAFPPEPPKRRNQPLDPQELEAVLPGIRDPGLRGEVEKARAVFAARTALPPAAADRLAAAKQGSVWKRGTAVRIEVVNRHADFRRQAAERLAGVLSEQGFRVDPSAPLVARLTVPEPEDDKEPTRVGGLIDMMWIDVGKITVQLEVVAPGGVVRAAVTRGPITEPIGKEAYEKVLRDRALGEIVSLRLPDGRPADAAEPVGDRRRLRAGADSLIAVA
jgi:hypothetical protein